MQTAEPRGTRGPVEAGVGKTADRPGLTLGVVTAVMLSVLALVTSVVAVVLAVRQPPALPTTAADDVLVAEEPLPVTGPAQGSGEFPSSATTGPRFAYDELEPSPRIVTTENGQVIEGLDVQSQIVVRHSDVVVRDVRIRFDGDRDGVYPIHITPRCDGCPAPTNVLIEYVEIAGEPGVALGPPAVFGPQGNWTLRHADIHGIGSGPRLTTNTAVEYSYVHDIPNTDPEEHKSAVGLNGGTGNRVVGNRLECAVPGCSAALAMYGDFSPVEDVLVEGNLFNTSGSYCVYGGSVEGKPYPVGADIRILNNHFGREHHEQCGIYGPVAAWDGSVEGNLWEGNVWADTGEPVEP